MGILLSDGEIKIAKAEALRLSWTHKAHHSYEKEKFLLEARARKIKGWLESFEFYEDAMGESVKLFKDKLVKTLLKEVE